MKLFQPFQSSSDQNSLDTGIEFTEPSLTKQSFSEDADINTIVERFGLTGEMPNNFAMPTYSDYDEVVDFQTAMNTVRAAGEQFLTLPPTLRERFQNDPQRLMAFLSDETNRQAAIDLGLVPTPPPTPSSAPAPSNAAPSGDSSST